MRLREAFVRHLVFSKLSIIEVRGLFTCNDYAFIWNVNTHVTSGGSSKYRFKKSQLLHADATRNVVEIIWRHSVYT